MQRNRPPSAQAISVLRALAADPARWRYGYDLVTEVHLKSGSLYPMLVRLADRGLLETSWEPGQGSRPPRHLYRLTLAGREYVAAMAAAAAGAVGVCAAVASGTGWVLAAGCSRRSRWCSWSASPSPRRPCCAAPGSPCPGCWAACSSP